MNTHRMYWMVAAAALICANWGITAQAALMAEYRFDDPTSQATFLKDDSGNGNDLAIHSVAPTQVAGGPFASTVGGSYANITASVDGMRATPSGFAVYDTHSLEMWIKPDQAPADNHINYFYTTSGAAIRLSVQPLKAAPTKQNLNFILRDSAGDYGTTTSIATVDNAGSNWFHIAYTYDANATSENFKIYLNGVLKKTVTIDLWQSYGTTFTLSGSNLYLGGVDEIAVYGNVRTAAQIEYDAQHSLAPVPEPAGVSVLLLGVGLLLGRRRRKMN